MVSSDVAVLIGAAGVIVGAAISGAAQMLVARSQYKRDQETRRLERKRTLYERYLALVSHLSADAWQALVSGKIGEWQFKVRSTLDELRVGIALDASPRVGRGLSELTTAVGAWASAIRDTKWDPKDKSVPEAMDALWDRMVYPSLTGVADLMADELGSRSEPARRKAATSDVPGTPPVSA